MRSSVNAELQRLWLDARCTPPTALHHDDKVNAFLSVFVVSFAGRKSTAFRTLFGDGMDLVVLLCRDYATLVRKLAQAEAAKRPETAALITVQLFAQALHLLIDDDAVTSVEAGQMASSYEAYANSNVVALSLVLHERALLWVRSARPEDASLAVVAQADAFLLQLIDAVLSCRRRELNRRSVLEAILCERVFSVAATAPVFLETPSAAGADAADSSCRILQQQLPNVLDLEVAHQTLQRLEDALVSSQRRVAGAVAAKFALSCFACLLENIVYAKQLVGFTPVENVNFDVVTATVLNFEKEVGDDGMPALERVTGCLRVLALADRPDLSTRRIPSPATNLGGSLLRLLPASVSKMPQRIVDSLTGGERREAPQGIRCDGAVDSLARLFVLSRNAAMSDMYGQQLFQLLSTASVSSGLVAFVLSICGEGAATFEAAKLRGLLNFVSTLECHGAVGDFLSAVVVQLGDGRFRLSGQRLVVVEFFIDWCPKAGSHTAMALALGLVQAAVRCMVALAADPKANDLDTFAERFSVLSKVVVSTKEATAPLTGDNFCEPLLQVMLTALDCGEVHTSVLLRDAFVGLVLKTDLFCNVLLEQIAAATSAGTWSTAATPLLSTLVLLLHSCGRHHRASLPHNSIELCLSLAQQVDDHSLHPAVDRHALGCCLSLLLVLVNYSDVWKLVESTMGTLPATRAHLQDLLDLCTGVFRSTENLTVAEGYFSDPTEVPGLWSAPQFTHIGPFAVLKEPYCEMVYPIKLLAQMTDVLLTEKHTDAASAADAVEYLVLQSGVMVPSAFLVSFIVKWERFSWLRCISNVCDPTLLPLFFNPSNAAVTIQKCQRMWLEALASTENEQDDANYGDYIHFGDGGGASGGITCGGDVWPPVDAYTTGMWIYVDPISQSGRQEGKVGLWQLAWDAVGRHFCVSLLAHTQRKCCLYNCDFGGDVTVVELPMLPERRWVHVATTHTRGKVFASQLKMFVNGVEVQRCGCPYPVSGLQTAAAMTSSLPSLLSRDVALTIGSPRDTPSNNATLRVIGFDLYASGATAKQITSMYAMGPFHSSNVWDGTGRHQSDLRVPSLSDQMVRYVEASLQSASLEAVVREQCVELVLPPTQVLVNLHVCAMIQVDTSFDYLDNKQWALRNMAPAMESTFSLYGYYHPPRGTHTNNVDALLCNGAFYEWLRWMAWVAGDYHHHRVAVESLAPTASAATDTTCSTCGAAIAGDEDDNSIGRTDAAVSQVAYNLMRIFSRCNKETDLLPSSWRRFIAQFTAHVTHQPQVYLRDPTAVSLLMRMVIKNIRYHDSHRRPVKGTLLTNLFLIEHIFVNWRLLSNLPEDCWTAVMTTLGLLVAPSNAIAGLNTARLLAADFVNGFVFGLLREYVAFPRLVAAVELIKAVLLTGQSTSELMERLLTACLLTIPCTTQATGGSTLESHLGSGLAATSFSYLVLVRNMLLRCLNEVLEMSLNDGNTTFLSVFAATVPDWWFAAMFSSGSHPVSATLSLRLFVLSFLYAKSFREGCTAVKAESIAQALEPHCHQRELMDLLVQGYMGTLWAMSSSHAAYSGVTWSGKTEMEGLLVLVVHLLKAQCQLLLRGSLVVSEEGTVRGYFSAAAATSAAPSSLPPTDRLSWRARQRWRRAGLAVRTVLRLRTRAKEASGGGSGGVAAAATALATASASAPLPAHVKPSTATLKESIREVMDWLTQSYRLSNTLRKSLYRSSDASNLIDLLMWPVLAALRTKEPIALKTTYAVDPMCGVPLREDKAVSVTSVSDLDAPEEEEEDEELPEENAEEDEWEVLPDPTTFETRSFGMDAVGPAEGMEAVYDACKLFFLTHAAARAATTDLLAAARGGTKVSKYVLSLHRALATEVKGIGSNTEDVRQAFLCAVWFKASEQCIDRISEYNASPVKRNALELGKYALDRLVSGGAVPPNGVAAYYRFLLARVEGDAEVTRQGRTAIFEWFMYVTSVSFYKLEAAKVSTVVDFAYGCVDTLFTSPMPATELLKTVVARLLQVTVCLWNAVADDKHPAIKKMGQLWKALLSANQRNVALPSLFKCNTTPPLDLFRNGFDRLLPPLSSVEVFVAWVRQRRQDVAQLLQSYGGAAYTYVMANGVEYLRLITRYTVASVAECDRHRRHVSSLALSYRTLWNGLYATTTFVDRALLACTASRYPNCYVLNGGAAAMNAAGDVCNEWCLRDGGAVGLCRRYVVEKVEEMSSDPLNFYIRYAPPVCLPLSRRDARGSAVMLRANARAVLAKVAGQGPGGSVVFVCNAYFVSGTESYICTTVLTQRELIIITCSTVTPTGDFFVEQTRLHTAAQQSHAKSSLLQQAFRYFTSGQASAAGSTSSKAAFRYSQYYRQLQTEAAKGSNALVWRCPLGVIVSVHQRLFQHLSAGLEVVLECGKSLFLVLLDDELSFSRASRDKLFSYFESDTDPTMANIATHSLNEKLWGLPVWTRRWVRRECSNYMYLRILNDAASRTVANLGQYPVMPWVLRNYAETTLDLEDRTAYRDLSKPVGALNEVKARQLQARYAEWISGDVTADPPYHYGTHYSTAAIVLYYLIRLQPFTAASVRFQGGRLDIADRLFHSVPEAWANSSGRSSGDVKELIPEFFHVSAFLRNKNGVVLGTRTDGDVMGDVLLPTWCNGSPFGFVYMNALALESEAASAALHRWIDLIFGYKQIGQPAVDAINVFSPLSYKEGVDRAINRAATDEDRRAIVASADNFGQTPLQLFPKELHPARKDAKSVKVTQTDMIESITDLTTRPCFGAQVCTRGNAPITSGVFCDDTLYLLDNLTAVGRERPSQLLRYQREMDRVVCTALRSNRVLATIDQIRASGCGPVRCLCASSRGSVVCVGTESGKVMVYSRETVCHRFFIIAVLDATIDATLAKAGGVRSLQLFEEGNLVVSYDGEAAVSGWHLSFLSTSFTFATTLATATDRSPVRAISRDTHTGVYYAAKPDSVVLFAPDGVVLAHHRMEALLMSAAPEYATRMADSCVTALLLANCASFSTSNLLLLGHSNGTVSLWCVVAAQTMTAETMPSGVPLWSFQFLHDVVFEQPVICLIASNEEHNFIVGLADNTARYLSFPFTEEESS